MKLKSRLLGLVSVVALMASSAALIGSPVIAQTIDSSITVENTQCIDTTPSSVGIPDTLSAGNRQVGGTSNVTVGGQQIPLAIYVNTCSQYGWAISATITDFTQGANSHPGSNFRVSGDSYYAGAVVGPSGFAVPGTTGTPWATNRQFTQSAGTGLWSPTTSLATGTSAATGEMWLYLNTMVLNIPWTLPAGTYSAQMTMTFTPAGP